jgi:hypothetical protein
LNAFSPAPSRVIVCSIGALAATVRPSVVNSDFTIAIASDIPWSSTCLGPIVVASLSITVVNSNAWRASRTLGHPACRV